ncbi:N-acyl-D-glucosamine 2-epimerase [Maribellus comscasis]|uniref:Cellobiose 2-epimerase n=1 Tax=Maribellus comscasis TaxID=2681766 RepID=A0A6I6JRX9_9BACT|nr:AGE family epimerase/isomerase [Maribellus comscasis]QGY42663.1 N-acyl-D-glucosamine 2-epimerase [Maribellus comscasis]
MKPEIFKREFENELTNNILKFWQEKVYDPQRKTFFGQVSNENETFPEEPHSAVLITRILWAFSSAYRVFPETGYKNMADEAYRILMENFWDNENGGIFWCVSPDGEALDTKKQFYAQAFFIYALSEYYLAFKNDMIKQLAISMFMLLERYGTEPGFGGYIEASTANWNSIEDQRLSPKDMNVRKSMNTHLHVLEAYTNLYRIWKDDALKEKLEALIHIFLDKIIDSKTGHFLLFFDDDWTIRGDIDSYGHDIEGSWLLYEAADVLGDEALINRIKPIALKMVKITIAEGLQENGGIFYEKENGKSLEEYHWWPQAEAVIGFFNAWQISGDIKYREFAKKSWEFIQKHIINPEYGEWFWARDKNFDLLPDHKINAWKAPYHNGRMCLEMIRRLEE